MSTKKAQTSTKLSGGFSNNATGVMQLKYTVQPKKKLDSRQILDWIITAVNICFKHVISLATF